MLLINDDAKFVEKSEQANKYLVFAIDKESYEKLYKDQVNILDVSFYNKELKRLTTNGDLKFEF